MSLFDGSASGRFDKFSIIKYHYTKLKVNSEAAHRFFSIKEHKCNLSIFYVCEEEQQCSEAGEIPVFSDEVFKRSQCFLKWADKTFFSKNRIPLKGLSVSAISLITLFVLHYNTEMSHNLFSHILSILGFAVIDDKT